MKTHGIIVVVTLLLSSLISTGQNIRKELPTNHAPADLLRPVLKKALSPQGRFVILPGKGKVMVIDTPDRVRAAELALALATLDTPAPDVQLDFAVNPGNAAPRKARSLNPPESWSDFPFPTAYLPPRIAGNGVGGFVVTPAHPTNFKRRKVGSILETQATANPDGSVTLDINSSNTGFVGFINYGSAIFGSGGAGIVPLNSQVPNPRFFAPLINSGPILMPIFDTTRISTQIIVRPSVSNNIVTVDMIPQLKVNNSIETSIEKEQTVSLKQFRTSMQIQNGKVGSVNGFKGASPKFNRSFLGGKKGGEGLTAIKIRARVQPGKKDSTVDSTDLNEDK